MGRPRIRSRSAPEIRRDASADSIGVRDPDGLKIVLLWINQELHAEPPPAWLYWYRLARSQPTTLTRLWQALDCQPGDLLSYHSADGQAEARPDSPI